MFFIAEALHLLPYPRQRPSAEAMTLSILERASGRMFECRAPPLTTYCMMHSDGWRVLKALSISQKVTDILIKF